MPFATASRATDITVAVAAARTTRYAVLLVLHRSGDAGDAPPRPGVAVSFAPPDVGGWPRRRGVTSRPRRVLLCGTLLLASHHRRFYCAIWRQSFASGSMAVDTDAGASVAADAWRLTCLRSSGADVDMAVGMATDVTADGPATTPGDAIDGTVTVHQGASNRRRGGNHNTEARERRRAAAFVAAPSPDCGEGGSGDTADTPGA